jgi:hypothetical protein
MENLLFHSKIWGEIWELNKALVPWYCSHHTKDEVFSFFLPLAATSGQIPWQMYAHAPTHAKRSFGLSLLSNLSL